MPGANGGGPAGSSSSARRQASDMNQFAAVLRKNFLLRTSASAGSGSGGFLSRGVKGWLGLCLEVGLPVLFFMIAALPRFYVAPTPLPRQFFPRGSLQSLDWVLEYYKGPAAASSSGALVLFAPNGTQELDMMEMTAKALSCSSLPSLSGSQDNSTAEGDESVGIFIQKFQDLFPLPGARPADCNLRELCMANPACYQPLLGRQLVGFATEEEAVGHSLNHPQTVDAVLVFKSIADGFRVSYDIRINHTLVPDTQTRLNKLQVRPGYQYRQYWFFSNIQQFLNKAIIGKASGNGTVPSDVTFGVKPYPWPAVLVNFAVFISGGFFKLLMVLAFLPQVRSAVVGIVQEKELRLREGMRTLGLHDDAYWASWALTHFTTLFISGIGCAVVGMYPFPHTSLSVMLVFYALSSLALIAFSYFLSTLFSTQRVAGFATIVFFAAAMLPGYLIPTLIAPYGGTSWALACVLPPSAITMMVECILSAEVVQRGVTWGTLGVSAAVESSFTPALLFAILIFDILFYGLLTWYCDQVLPNEWGQRRHWCFPFTAQFWKFFLASSHTSIDDSRLQEPLLPGSTAALEDAVAIRITGLSKTFKCSDGTIKHAVKDLSLDMQKGQITALLGHNGAGKTTTISVLTGMLQASSGSATVNGLSIDKDMAEIRRSLGLCPQFDILWPTISVRDHLWLYAAIKGLTGTEATDAVWAAVQDVGLSDKLDCPAGELSGGEARKLSVAIAFMGRPAVIFLDEPTSTMDPYSRRFTWDVIRRNREGCAIILTTHSMEEADVLSDTIAIMKGGQLAAAGSSLELKSAYGAGYNLHILTGGVPPGCQATGAALQELVTRNVEGASLLCHAGSEIAFRLPKAASGSFGNMLRELEERKADLSVSSYGLSMTTLEEVFLEVSKHSDAESDGEHGEPVIAGGSDALPQAPSLRDSDQPAESPRKIYLFKLAALLEKRAVCSWRDWGATATQLVVPLLLVIAALYARTSTVRIDQLPHMAINRKHSVFGLPAALSVSPMAQADQQALATFQQSYPSSEFLPTGTSAMQDWFHPAKGTLDDWLLANWYTSNNHTYDALFVERLPVLGAHGSNGNGAAFTVLVNETACHALPLAINQASTALLRMVAGPQAEITVGSKPLPALPTELSEQLENAAGNLLLVLLTMLAMAGLSASFSVFLVREAASSSKLVQLVAGAPRSAFWLANYIFDFSLSCVVLLATLLLFSLSGLAGLSGGNTGALCVLLVLFGLASVPLTYCLHFLYQDEMEAMQGINTLLTSVGVLGFLVVWILDSIYQLFMFPNVLKLVTTMKTVLRIFSPHYCMGQGIYQLASTGGNANQSGYNPWAQAGEFSASPAVPSPARQWCGVSKRACGYFAFTLAVEVLYERQAALWAALQSRVHSRPPSDDAEDGEESPPPSSGQDLAQERQHAQAASEDSASDYQLVMTGMGRAYSRGLLARPFQAVRDMWLTVKQGECLGLLGVSGAGKTTSFKVAIGDLPPTSGDVLVCGKSVTTSLADVRQSLGYCPQADPLLPLLTATEMLKLFATLRGVPQPEIPGLVTSMMAQLGLQEYAHRVCGSYSGGNKRKLSVSAALVGKPAVVLLDEPSAGLDPGARQFLWRFMSGQVLGAQRSVVLTSHSMEECEVLCSRIAIMSAGALQCVGTSQQLKERFAHGYTLELRFASGLPLASQADSSHRFLTELESTGKVLEADPRRRVFQLPAASLNLARVFEDVEAHRAALGITDYALSQTTLEQVFLQVAHRKDVSHR
eukprot:jgi/Tetstr1/425284/TSEL_015736.t1